MVLGQNVILEKVATGPRRWLLGLSGEVYYNNMCREFGVVEVVEGEGGSSREGRGEGGREVKKCHECVYMYIMCTSRHHANRCQTISG